MKNIKRQLGFLFSGVLTFVAVFGFSSLAQAATPTLSVSNTGSNLVILTVTNADPNSSISLFRNQPNSSAVFVATIGTTNSSGYFSTTLNQNSYFIPQNSNVYVLVNGQASSGVMWPNYAGSQGNISLSQTSVTLALNQSASVNVYGGNGSYYVSSNSNSSVASATLNGSTLNIYSNSISGNTTITICSYNTNGCATLYIYVQTNYNQNISLSQSSLSLYVGRGQAISIYGGGSYSISSNSNPTAISSLISGNTLNVFGSAPGSGTLNICSSSGSAGCATLNVTVGGYYPGYTGYTGYNNYTGGNYYNAYYTSQPSPYYVQSYLNQAPYYSNLNQQQYYSNLSTTGRTGSQIYLSQVPATGISFANLKTILFVLGLSIWSIFAAYIYMAKQKRRLQSR